MGKNGEERNTIVKNEINNLKKLNKIKNKIQIFDNPEFGRIRVVLNEENEPLFCLTDVAKALGYTRPADAITAHCKGVSILPTPTAGGTQSMKYGKEGEVYRLVMRSKLPDAEKFQDWVCEEVLPSIRKYGGYLNPNADIDFSDPDKVLVLVQNWKEEKERRLALEQEKKENLPKIVYTDAVKASKSCVLVGTLAKMIKQNGYDIGQNRLYNWLADNKYLIRKSRYSQSKGRYEYSYMPTQRAMNLELFHVEPQEIPTRAGEPPIIKYTCYVTGKGQVYFINKFIELLNPVEYAN